MRRGSIVALAISALAACGALAAGPGLAFATASAAARPAASAARPAGARPAASAAASAVASAAALGWGNAQALPGIAALDDGGGAAPLTLSCSSPGNCAVGGGYDDPADGAGSAAFVADQRNGAWDKAIEVPGLAALNGGKVAQVDSLSCASAGDCTAGGLYSPGAAEGGGTALALDAFVATEKNGTWGSAVEVPGTAALNAGNWAAVNSVSCWAPGDCVAAGDYAPGGAARQQLIDSGAFVVTEKNGAWGDAMDPPGLAALNAGDASSAYSVSCSAGGSCAVGGFYTTASGQQQAFVADESAGTWQPAEEVPGTGALNVNGEAGVTDVSCASPGNCGATGNYSGNSGGSFVASEINGTWRTADALPDGVSAGAISCASAGDCVAGGSSAAGVTTTGGPGSQASVITEVNGTWGQPAPVPGLAGLNTGQAAAIASVSCSGPGDCAAGGSYAGTQTARTTADQAFVVTETDGTWGRAEEVPGISALTATDAATINAVSCASPQACTATGLDGAGSGFLVSTRAPTATTESLSAATVTYGREQAERVSAAVTAKTGELVAGKVTVKAGSVTLCVIILRSGRGSCTLTARPLPPGTYRVTAAYPGSPGFTGSVSPAMTLTVVKQRSPVKTKSTSRNGRVTSPVRQHFSPRG